MSVLKKIISRFRKEDGIFFDKIKKIIGFSPSDISYYIEAFTHPTFNKGIQQQTSDYQRLEFLGDSVISTIVSEYLFEQYPNENEGFLTNMRSKLVCRKRLNEVGKELSLLSVLRFGHNDNNNLGDNINGNLTEALVGAIYLDLGYKKSKTFVLNKIIDKKHNLAKEFEKQIISYKSFITEWGQKHKKR